MSEEAEEKAPSRHVPGEKFLEARTVLVFGGIEDKLAKSVVEQILYLDHIKTAPIKLIISSPGGHVESGDAVHDIIRYVRSPVIAIGSGWVASAGAHIFLAAEKENRICLPNTRFLIHQPAGGAQGRAGDIEIQANQIIKMRERLARVISERTGQPLERVQADIERDYWMTTEEAIAYGILDKVVQTAADVDGLAVMKG
jgi:ATP-dependent Clp protease, protease subunit